MIILGIKIAYTSCWYVGQTSGKLSGCQEQSFIISLVILFSQDKRPSDRQEDELEILVIKMVKSISDLRKQVGRHLASNIRSIERFH